jgi:hypothetical protein
MGYMIEYKEIGNTNRYSALNKLIANLVVETKSIK